MLFIQSGLVQFGVPVLVFFFFFKGRCGIKSWKNILFHSFPSFLSWTRWFICNITVQEICLNHQHLMRLDVPFSMDCIADWWGHVTDKQSFIPGSIYSLHRVLSYNYIFFSSTHMGTFYHWCPAKQYQSNKLR